jgi:hypothetical protein
LGNTATDVPGPVVLHVTTPSRTMTVPAAYCTPAGGPRAAHGMIPPTTKPSPGGGFGDPHALAPKRSANRIDVHEVVLADLFLKLSRAANMDIG